MADQIIVRVIAGVVPMPTSTGRNRWIVSDDQGQEWTCWEPNVAMMASQLVGQLAQMQVRIAPARDPQYGMNYSLKGIQAAPPGSQPTGPLPLMQPGQQQMNGPGMGGFQPQPVPFAGMGPTPGMGMQPPQMPMPQMPQAMQMPQKTLGQGGQFSDADLLRMARSTAIDAVIGVAFTSDDFRDDNGDVDWERLYAVAEAASKFITHRKHEGWTPGVEINPRDNEAAVMAEVHAQFPGTEQLPQPQMPQPAAMGDDDNDVPWEQ